MNRKKLIFPFILFLITGILTHIHIPSAPLNTFFKVLGDVVIVVICLCWFIDISKHITNKKIGFYLKTVCCLCIFWIIIKALKWEIFYSDTSDVYRLLWYSYYIPAVLLPLFSLYVSLYAGKLPDYKPPEKLKLLFIPAVALIGLVLTNDIHHFVFRFGEGSNYDSYSYGIGHRIVSVWIYGLILLFLGILYKNSKIPDSRHRSFIPLIPVVFLSVYLIAYPWLMDTVFYKDFNLPAVSIMFVYYLYNCCCYVGLISYNGNYGLIFRNSSVNALITDEDYNIIYKSGTQTGHITDLKNTETDSPDLILKKSAIGDGWVFRLEDVSEINEYIAELTETKEALKSENEILKADFEIRSRNEKIRKKIELYDTIGSAVKPQIDKIKALTEKPDCDSETLTDICFLCAYIKRKSNLILLNENSEKLSFSELKLCIKESLSCAQLCGMVYAIKLESEKTVPGSLLIQSYDWFEDKLENSIKNPTYIYVALTENNEGFTLSILTEDKDGNTENFSHTFSFAEVQL